MSQLIRYILFIAYIVYVLFSYLSADIDIYRMQNKFYGQIIDIEDLNDKKQYKVRCIKYLHNSEYLVDCSMIVYIKSIKEINTYLVGDYIVYNSGITLINRSELSLRLFFFKIKYFLLNRMKLVLPPLYASLANGILLGSREVMSFAGIKSLFKDSGLIHILALSGYNIMIIVIFLNYLLKYFSINIRLVITSIFIILFVLIVGFESSVVRAAIMGVINLFVLWSGRRLNVYYVLFYAFFVMTVLDPSIAFLDIGFQLSFLATFGIILYGKILNDNFIFISDLFGIRESLATTISAQLLVGPLLLFYFGEFKLIGIVCNVIVAFFLPLAMFFSFVVLIISLFSMKTAVFISFIPLGFLKIVVWVAVLVNSY